MPAPETSKSKSQTPPDALTAGADSSVCAKASLQAEIVRLRKQTVEQRILSALSMKSKFSWLQPAPLGGLGAVNARTQANGRRRS